MSHCLLLFFLPFPAETINYTYDDTLRLTKAQYGDGTAVEYIYDNLGNRLIKTTTLPGAPANNPPNAATNPAPVNNTTAVTTTPTLSWTGGGDPNSGDSVIYSVYFGTDTTQPLVANGPQTSFSPGQLQAMTTYYWKVVTKDNHNATTESPLWSFTTTNDPPVASFTVVDHTEGWAPLTVNFTDTSLDPDGDAIVSWAWDFNGDGIIDSHDRNPKFSYTSWGTYTASLSVSDVYGATSTKTVTISVYDDEHPDNNTAIYCISNSVGLQGALAQAQANGKNNIIHLVQGTYGISNPSGGTYYFDYYNSNPYHLFIKGGYASGCTSRELNPSNTVIDGENQNIGYSSLFKSSK